MLRLKPQLASLSYLIFVAPLARFAVAKIELFLNTIQIKSKSRAQVSLYKEIREGYLKPESHFNEALSAARPGKETPTRGIEAEI